MDWRRANAAPVSFLQENLNFMGPRLKHVPQTVGFLLSALLNVGVLRAAPVDLEKLKVEAEDGNAWLAAMMCPCGCGEILHMSLLEDDKPRWDLSEDYSGTASLHPTNSARGCVRRGNGGHAMPVPRKARRGRPSGSPTRLAGPSARPRWAPTSSTRPAWSCTLTPSSRPPGTSSPMAAI